MNTPEQNYKVIEKETLTVIFSLKKFRHCLMPAEKVALIPDHQAFGSAFEKTVGSGRLVRWLDPIVDYFFDIFYNNRKANLPVDNLSRQSTNSNKKSECF